jgi:formate dehydrogenase iron-sulfur subunit
MSASLLQENPRTLIDELLEEQQRLTPVERFSNRKDLGALPAQAKYYRDLIPLSKPAAGEQYAFAVDMDRCTGCKACVTACHSLNGLDEGEAWRDTGLILGGPETAPYQQTVTTACHHCAEPGCMEGCPVRAYEKDAETGIVRHLDDQCIGCQYCVLKCPYDVPKYSKVRGIVRKCDMCHSRLSVREAPACVQACPSEAITIRIVDKAGLVSDLRPEATLLPGAFRSSYTKPSTTYTTRQAIPVDARASDSGVLRLEPAHWPLVWMLILTQMATGLFVTAALLEAMNPAVFAEIGGAVAVIAFIALNAGLGSSTLHLGRPLGAWRAFLGLRTSWMSREILAFGVFAMVAGGFCMSALWGRLVTILPQLRIVEQVLHPASLLLPAGFLTVVLGGVSVFCSGMIYVDTHRALWRAKNTAVRFGGALALLGASATAMIFAWGGVLGNEQTARLAPLLGAVTMLIRTVLFALDFRWLQQAGEIGHPDHTSVRMAFGLCGGSIRARRVLFVGSTAFGLLGIMNPGWVGAIFATLSLLTTFGSQVIERYLYFTTVVAYRMPGFLTPAAHPVR